MGSQGGPTAGKAFTPAQKRTAVEENTTKNNGKTVCEDCGTETVPSQKSQKGVKPPGNESQVDHIFPKSKGGNTTPENTQILCRDCNREKSNQLPQVYYKKDDKKQP